MPVMRRLRLNLELDGNGIPINGFENVTHVLRSAFQEELAIHSQGGGRSLLGLSYQDEDKDDIVISSNHELAVALHYALRMHQAQNSFAASEPTLRLTMFCNG